MNQGLKSDYFRWVDQGSLPWRGESCTKNWNDAWVSHTNIWGKSITGREEWVQRPWGRNLPGSFKELEGVPPLILMPSFQLSQTSHSSSCLFSSCDIGGEVPLHSGNLAYPLLPSFTPCNPQAPRAAPWTANASNASRNTTLATLKARVPSSTVTSVQTPFSVPPMSLSHTGSRSGPGYLAWNPGSICNWQYDLRQVI